MDDKKLLELAAKAAGIEWNVDTDFGLIDKSTRQDCPKLWNPLKDDGDALRLAVKLNLLDVPDLEANTYGRIYGDNDPYAATRRAIVRAAAGLSKKMT